MSHDSPTAISKFLSYVLRHEPQAIGLQLDSEGLVAGARHHVHLSQDVETAWQVGQRYGSPVILEVDALRMHEQGCEFFQADNGVWLTQAVPGEFLRRA